MGKSGYKVDLSPLARQDLESIVAFIAADKPAAAEQFGLRLIDEAEAIAAHPLAGRMVPEFRDAAVRERIFRSYRIVYRVHSESKLIVVSRFWHAARGKPVVDDLDEKAP